MVGEGFRCDWLETFADPALLAQAWPRLLEAASREATGSEPKTTPGYQAGQFIGMVDQMQGTPGPGHRIGLALHAENGPLELRGVTDGDRLLHALVISRERVTT